MASTPWVRLGRLLSPPESTARQNGRQAHSVFIRAERLVDLRLPPALGAMLLCALAVLLSGCSPSQHRVLPGATITQ